jgi:hypothetical protein
MRILAVGTLGCVDKGKESSEREPCVGQRKQFGLGGGILVFSPANSMPVKLA